MKRLNASVMTVAVVLALIAFVAPSSAYSIENGAVSYEPKEDLTTWTSRVICASEDTSDISNFMLAWCNPNAVLEVWVDGEKLDKEGNPKGWDYGEFDTLRYLVRGIKIDYPVVCETSIGIDVKIILKGEYDTSPWVNYQIKAAGSIYPESPGSVFGPVAGGACADPIPEFSTIAIPIASILGLLFFFNHRKRRKEE